MNLKNQNTDLVANEPNMEMTLNIFDRQGFIRGE